jgi:GNAT superfamily N-acetyltransferase
VTDLAVERVEPSVTFPLRHAVLRPHQAPESLALAGDDDPDTATFAVRDPATGEVLTTANVRRQAPPDGLGERAEPGEATWRLRGMATRDDLRGQGLGRMVLDACVEHVAARGGGFLWCSARIRARRFYERALFEVFGDEYDVPDIGRHMLMFRRVESRERRSEEAG